MEKSKFSVTRKDRSIVELVRKTDHKILGIWAVDCAIRVLPYFEKKYPEDKRLLIAIEVLRKWINTRIFKMADIREAALNAHAAAREVGEDNAARSAARAIGQAVSTAHVPTHCLGAANYALQATYRSANSSDANTLLDKEHKWQFQHLIDLRNKI